MTAFYRFIKTIAYPVVKFMTWFRTSGKENIPRAGGLILCANHTSMIDIGLLVVTCNRPIYFMAKEELFQNPFLGWFFRKMGAFPIVRGKGDGAALKQAEEIVKRGDILGIFPEGTRTRDPLGHPGRGKSGAAMIASATGADVLPCAIHYEGYQGKVHFFRESYVRYGEIIPATDLTIEQLDRTQVRRASERIMAAIIDLWEEETGWKSN